MSRKPRFNLPGLLQHVIQSGNNREPCFYVENNRGHDYMAKIVPNNPFAFPPSMEVSVRGTIPGKESVESSLERRPRITHMYRKYGIRVTHNTMDGV